MKKALIVLISIIILLSCKSTPEEIDEYKSIKDILAGYDISVLSKIKNNALPRYTAVFSSDFRQLGEYDGELGKLMRKQLESAGRLSIVDEKKISKIKSENKLFPEYNPEDLHNLAVLAGSDYYIKAYADSTKIDYLKREDVIQTDITLKFDLYKTADDKLFKSLVSSASVKSRKTGDMDHNEASLYKAAQTGIKEIIRQIKLTFPAFGFVLRKDGLVYTTDLGKNVLAENGQTVAFISQGKFDPENPDAYIIDFYTSGIISEVDDISSKVTVSEENRPPGNAIVVLIEQL